MFRMDVFSKMVRTRPVNKFAKDNLRLTQVMINDVFGRTLTLRRSTYTYDDYGQIATHSTADTSFVGDLQYGQSLDPRFIESGIVEVGEGVLYIHPDALDTSPAPEDIIVDGVNIWEIISRVEAPEMGGTVCHYSYRCRRRIETGDT